MVQITISVFVLQMESKDSFRVTCIRCKIRWMEGYVGFESNDLDSLD